MSETETNDDVMDLSNEDFTEEPRIYEVSYLFVPSLTEEAVSEEVAKIKEFFSKNGGEVLHEGAPKKIALAYPMTKSVSNKKTVYEQAFFGWIKFTMSQEVINEFKKTLDANDNIIRFLIIKTIKETPIAKPTTRRVYKKKDDAPKKTIDEKTGPVDEAELDKEIEELLVS